MLHLRQPTNLCRLKCLVFRTLFMNLLPIFLARQTDKNILYWMQVSLGFLQSSKWVQLHWELRGNLRQKDYNQLLRLYVDYCILGCSNVWISPQSICYRFFGLFGFGLFFFPLSLLARICWAYLYWERGRFGQLLLTIKYKLTSSHIFLYSSITGSLKAVTYQELGQGILIKDCRAPPLKSDHQSIMLI